MAVTQMDQVTQQNAALVEEVATTAVGVEEQAALLAQAVAVFQLVEGNAPGRSAGIGGRCRLGITPPHCI